MRLLRYFLLALILLNGCTEPSPPKVPTTKVMELLYNDVAAHFEGYALLEKTISQTGHRLTGSENGKNAEKLVFEGLSHFGLDAVSYDPFNVVAWQRGEISLETDFAKKGVYAYMPAVTLAHSPVSASFEGIIIDAGNGLKADFDSLGERVNGKIALVNIGIYPKNKDLRNLHRSEKAALAIQAGAAGIIMVNTVEGQILLTGTASTTGELLPVPAVCISLEDAENLRVALQKRPKALSAKIEMTNFSGPITARNIIARWNGSELRGEKIVIGGHLDSWDLAEGAIDNGLGSFTVIDVARAFASVGQHPKRTVEFVLFMGEEQGLLGSKHYIERSMADHSIDSIRYMINLDMTGNPNGFNISGRPEMKDLMTQIGLEIQKVDTLFSNKLAEGAGLHSDHQPFMLQGIPVLGLMSNLDPEIYKFYHSDQDDFPLVDPNHMRNGSKFTAMALYALADADSIPAKRLNDAETKDFLLRENLKEPLVLRKEWRWND